MLSEPEEKSYLIQRSEQFPNFCHLKAFCLSRAHEQAATYWQPLGNAKHKDVCELPLPHTSNIVSMSTQDVNCSVA